MKRLVIVIGMIVLSSCIVTGCSSVQAESDIPQDPIIITGKITDIDEGSLGIDVLTGLHIEKAIVQINEATTFVEGVSNEFKVDNIIIFEITGEIMESYPIQVIAKEISANEPPQK